MEQFHNALKTLICKKQGKCGCDSEVTPAVFRLTPELNPSEQGSLSECFIGDFKF